MVPRVSCGDIQNSNQVRAVEDSRPALVTGVSMIGAGHEVAIVATRKVSVLVLDMDLLGELAVDWYKINGCEYSVAAT